MSQRPDPPAAPPSYTEAVGSKPAASSHLQVPQSHNGIPAHHRRSMEDEQRPLPAGWVRQWDQKEQHQFFVNTKADPPRSIWHHPYDDEEYLKGLSSEERERIQDAEAKRKIHLDASDDESSTPVKAGAAYAHSSTSSAPEVSGDSSSKKHKLGFGEKLKNKVTGMTHEERQAEKARKEEEERQYYEAHRRFREALQRAQVTGQPQWYAKDKDGKDIYIEPPQSMYGGGYGGGGYGGTGYGYNPYTSGPYADPNARFVRPQMPYGRPYGGMYGGGMGMPLMGGMLGGMMLGGLLF